MFRVTILPIRQTPFFPATTSRNCAPPAITPDRAAMPPQISSNDSGGAAKIVVTRDSPDDVQVRQIVVSLDGLRKAELMFGDSITLTAAPGPHTLGVDNTWNHQDLA